MSIASDPFEGVLTLAFSSESAWLAGRQLTVGSSEIAALVGHGYAGQNPLTIWAEKTGKAENVWSEDQKEWLAIGKAGEPFARSAFEIKTGLRLNWDEKLTVRVNPDFPAFGASIDSWTFIDGSATGYVAGDELAVVECKVINPRDLWSYQLDELPLKFTIQIQHQMAAVDAKHGFLCAVCGTEVVIRYVPRHQELIEALHAKAKEFLVLCRDEKMPELDGSAATAQVLHRMYPEVEVDSVCVLPEDFSGYGGKREALKEREAEIKQQVELLNSQIKKEMQDREYAVTPDGEAFSWKLGKRGRSFRALDKAPLALRKTMEKLGINERS